MVELLNRSNYLGFVSGGKSPRYPENVVVLYDLSSKSPISEYSVPLPVVAFRLTYNFVVVLTLSDIYVFSLSDQPELLYHCATADNPYGVVEVTCQKELTPTCVFPARRIGALHVIADLGECNQSLHTQTSFTPASIIASQSSVAAVAVSADGRFLAASSVRGTLIRLFSLLGQRPLLVEFRRGAEAAHILTLAFAPPSESSHILLLAASDTGTAHVFGYSLPDAELAGSPRGPRQRYSILSSAARVVAATSAAASGGGNAVVSSGAPPASSKVPHLLDSCRFNVGTQAAKATRLLSNTHAVALSPDGRIQRFAILPSDGIARPDIIDTFLEPFDDI